MFLFQISHLTKSFSQDKTKFNAVSDVSFNLPTNGLVSIVGKSGCGKSTLLNLIMGIEKRTSGKILYCGKDISKFNEKTFSNYHIKEVSMVYQHYNLLNDLTAAENIALPLEIAGKSKRNALKISRKLLGNFNLDYLKNKNVRYLSGGEKQRVALLRALVNDPKAILCDEPTGALDNKNSKIIMDELKKISNTRLVLMVSHNNDLVEKYSDRIIRMKNGRITHIHEIGNCGYDKRSADDEHSYKDGWTRRLARKIFKRHIAKSFFSFIACTFGFAVLLTSVGFICGSKESQENALSRNLAVGTATVSKTTYYSLQNSPLQFKKTVRPSYDLIDEYFGDFDTIHFRTNTNFLFSPYPNGMFNGEQIDGFEMIPVLEKYPKNMANNMRIAGDFNNFSLTNVIVNEEFIKQLNMSKKESLNKTIEISNSVTISYPTGNVENPLIKDTFSYHEKLNIIAVVKEFSFLNSPKVYYSYDDLEWRLKNEKMPWLSNYLNKEISYFDYLEQSLEDQPQTSYSYFLFLDSLEEKENYFRIIKETTDANSPLQITSVGYDIAESYSAFISSFSDALIFFVIIGFLGVIFILGMVSLSNFLESKKDSAILSCLGSRNFSIQHIFSNNNLIISIFSFVFSLLLSRVFQAVINAFAKTNFGLENLVNIPFKTFLGIPYGLPIMLFLVAFISTMIFTILPIKIYKKNSISNELRDE